MDADGRDTATGGGAVREHWGGWAASRFVCIASAAAAAFSTQAAHNLGRANVLGVRTRTEGLLGCSKATDGTCGAIAAATAVCGHGRASIFGGRGERSGRTPMQVGGRGFRVRECWGRWRQWTLCTGAAAVVQAGSVGAADSVAESPQPSSLDALLSVQNQFEGLTGAAVFGSSTSAS